MCICLAGLCWEFQVSNEAPCLLDILGCRAHQVCSDTWTEVGFAKVGGVDVRLSTTCKAAQMATGPSHEQGWSLTLCRKLALLDRPSPPEAKLCNL